MWVPAYQYVPLFALAATLIGGPSADAPKELQVKPGARIVAIGDSITKEGGYLRDVDTVFAQKFPQLNLGRIVNKGIAGQRAGDMAARFDRDVIERKPDLVILSVGINDVLLPLLEKQPNDPKVLEAYRRDVAEMVRKAQAIGAKVLLLTPTILDEDEASEGNVRLAGYVEAERQIAAERGCLLSDTHALFLEAVKHKPADWKDGLFATRDGCHMAPLGDAILAIGVLRGLGVPERTILDTEIMTRPGWTGVSIAAACGFAGAFVLIALVRVLRRRFRRA